MTTNINNLNILTFIKDIYLSLKHIDNCFNSYKDNIDSKLSKLEDNQNTILDRLNNIEQLLDKINLNTQNQVALDKNIENELMQKMNTLNNNNFQDKINLKPEELTFANILENKYSLLDINTVLLGAGQGQGQEQYIFSDFDVDNLEIKNEKSNNNIETLDNLLF